MNEPCYKEVQDFYIFDLKKPILKEANAWPQAGKSSSSSGVSLPCPYPSLPLEFCSAYENFGRCDQERDNSIAAQYWDIMDYMDPQGHKLCGTYIKDILCQALWSSALSRSLAWVLEESGGCVQLCLAEGADGLRNLVLMAHATDQTHRAFVAEQLGHRGAVPGGAIPGYSEHSAGYPVAGG
ncbi:hypothetical protein DUI87_09869 [Hirundo rustica rustica]|uniref:Uncharacterized protein n=1 Tax=Hirundo rustica rustica TaxID=333673 RepID=A0A3M0KM82_HIRRU|nr:hypothetical protein DUI87_09869 [Hirundo rustica rustica]